LTGLWHAAESVAARFSDVDPRLLAAALVLHITNHGLRSLAWRNVLAAAYPTTRVPILGVASAYAVGVALNAVVPGRGGDAAKVALVRVGIGGSNVATIASTMSVVVLFDLAAATLIVLGAAAGGTIPFSPQLNNLPVVAVGLVAVVALVAVAGRRLRPALQRIWAAARQGGAILRTPGRYARRVAAPQAGAWACRITVVYLLMAAFGLPATVSGAAVVMVLCGASTLVPLTPGGAGTQQVMLTFALSEAATAAAVLSFSITAVNALLGVLASMVAFRTLHPVAAVRAGIRLARA
jgi:glycosyltransferase 2 family protein